MQPLEIPEPVLGPQIEWMLLSHQVSQDELIEALVRDHYLAIYRHVLSQAEDARLANRCARLTILRALERAHTYRIGQGVENWIKELGDEVHQSNLRRQRLGALLQRTIPATGWIRRNNPTKKFPQDASELSEAQVQFLAGAVASELSSTRNRRRLLRSIVWLAFAGLALLVLVILNFPEESFSATNDLSPTTVEETFSEQREHGTSRNTQAAPVVQLEEINLLEAGSSIQEILQHIRESSQIWSNLWADGLIIDFGPVGYSGPAIIHREQIWLEPPDRSRVLSGSLYEGEVDKLWIASSGQVIKEELDKIGWKHYSGGGLIEYTALRPLLRPAFAYFQEGRTVILGTEIVAGRDTIILDYYLRSGRHEGRYSIDVRTGIALRLLRYTDNSLEWVREELLITEIEYNYDTDASTFLFEPSDQHSIAYAVGPAGLPETAQSRVINVHGAGLGRRVSLPQLVPPPDFDPGLHDLTFQFTEITRLGGLSDHAEIFAGSYHLGSVALDDPWRLQCSRSPDGEMVAFYAEAASYDEDATPLRWIELDDLGEVHSTLPRLIPASNLAFSPDGQQLALAACPSESKQDCGLYLINLYSRSANQMVDLQGASSLVWSPDGKQIAFLGGRDGDPEWRIYVMDAQTGETVYKGRVSWEVNSFRAASDAPINEWDVRFPVFTRGLSDCISATQTSR